MSNRNMFFLAGSLSLLPAILLAQSYTASVRGVVTDPSQAAMPGAKVIVTDVNRNTTHSATTDSSGRYVITALPPGNYELTVEASGFNKYSQATFPLQVQQQATLDVQLSVGALATSVQVESSAPLINTTSASLGQ